MKRKSLLWALSLGVASVSAYFLYSATISPHNNVLAARRFITQGSLQVLDKEGNPRAFCPLKSTEVNAELSGGLSRVTVSQYFTNPFQEPIEAIYAFPLPNRAAVDDMTMNIDERTVRGVIKRREEARAIYEAARDAGKVAALLDQERPNIFTQAVANITPGAQIKIVISYVEVLNYDHGSYQFVFPMVVGPRYIPGAPVGKQGGGWASDTDQVQDASKITPPVVPERTRAGHDISIKLSVDTGVNLEGIGSPSHEIEVTRNGTSKATLALKSGTTIPNKDFLVNFDVSGKQMSDAVLTHRAERGGFFSLILQPPDRPATKDITPKELVFVLDTSGSMSGFPIDKAKETMKLALAGMNPADTFNIITFAGDTHVLFREPVPATIENVRLAQAFLSSRSGRGGTEMMKAIRTALDPTDNQNHLRVVCFMTDGYVGNDFAIIGEIQRHPNARIFSFGIGSSVNRFLLDKMAEVGRGEVEYVALTDDGSAAAKRFHERVQSPLLTDIELNWGGVAVTDVYPKRIPDLFSAKPVVVTGRYLGASSGTLRLSGKVAGNFYSREIPLSFPESEPAHDVLATLWARAKVEDLMSSDYASLQNSEAPAETREAIAKLGLEYRLMTQFTSFVAVEERIITDGGKPRRVQVPVEMPEGVRHRGVFGDKSEANAGQNGVVSNSVASLPLAEMSNVRVGRRADAAKSKPASGSGYGIGGGSGTGSAPLPLPTPVPPGVTGTGTSGRIHPAIASVVEKLAKNQPLASTDGKFIKNGKAEVQIWLKEKTPAAIAELKKLGVEVLVDAPNSRLIIARIATEKLSALTALTFITYIAPEN